MRRAAGEGKPLLANEIAEHSVSSPNPLARYTNVAARVNCAEDVGALRLSSQVRVNPIPLSMHH